MPRVNRKSWRLKFVDLESSFSIVDNSTPISGYMVCRAPKGETSAMYFGPQNSQAIDAMIGVASANWPDLIEAQAFNNEYGLYISAPPGTDSLYPSHIGGFFVAKNGIHKFYNVGSKEELEPTDDGAIPPYKVSVHPTNENAFDFTVQNSVIEITSPIFNTATAVTSDNGKYSLITDGENKYVTIKNVPTKVLNKLFQIDYDVIENLTMLPTKSAIWDSLDNAFSDDDGLLVNYLDVEGNTSVKDIRIDLDIETFLGATNVLAFTTEDVFDNSKFLNLLELGYTTINDVKYKTGFAFADLFHEVVNIQEDVYAYVTQKSVTEKQTNITITNIGYDKYFYDEVFEYSLVTDFDTAVASATATSPEKIAFYTEIGDVTTVKLFEKFMVNDTTYNYLDVTADYETKYITFAHAKNLADDGITLPENQALYHKIWYVGDQGPIHVRTEEECIEYENDYARGVALYNSGLATYPATVALKDASFNTMSFSCNEEVYSGTLTTGGSFVGSFDEYGSDTYGTNIYFPNVLSDDDFSFIEIRVIKKFGDEADDLDNGFWVHKRAIDKLDMDMYEGTIDQLVFTIEGDRYVDYLMNLNLVEGKVGGLWRNAHSDVLKAGLVEALNPDYDDTYVFIEPSGDTSLKTSLTAIRVAQELATVITPFLVPTTSVSSGMLTPINAQKLTVIGRYRGISTWCGEFEVYDTVTSKKYWRKPIGEVGLMLARIMDQKLGAWAPAWTNTGTVGGQLSFSALRARYGYDDSSIADQLKVTYILDQKGINPIMFNPEDGIMMLSSKTTEDPNNISQWSFLENQMSFDLVKREIRDSVMRPQIKKPINSYYMGIRQLQVDAILAKRTSGNQKLWYSAEADVAGANTDMTKAARKFVIRVKVVPNVFAETVELQLEVGV